LILRVQVSNSFLFFIFINFIGNSTYAWKEFLGYRNISFASLWLSSEIAETENIVAIPSIAAAVAIIYNPTQLPSDLFISRYVLKLVPAELLTIFEEMRL
jgi:hypothetical protein